MFRQYFCYCFAASIPFLALTPRITSAQPEILAQWGVAGKLPGEIDDLRDIAVDNNGNVFLIDRNRLQKFTNDGSFLFKTSYGGEEPFQIPSDIVVDQNNEVLLIDSNYRRVIVLDNKGGLITTWSWHALLKGVAIGFNNEHYFQRSIGVSEFTREGDALGMWITTSGTHTFTFTIDSEGSAYFGGEKIYKYSVDGEFLFSAELSNNPDHDVNDVRGIAVDHNGLIYTVNWGPNVRVYDQNGRYLTYWTGHVRAVEIAVGPDGSIYVADAGSHQVTRYAPLVEVPPPPPPPPPPDWYPEPREPALVLHIGEVTTPGEACSSVPTSSSEVVTKARASSDGTARYFVYLLGAPEVPVYDIESNDFPGMAGIQVGIDYDRGNPQKRGLEVLQWTRCSDLEFAGDDWPASGSGNTITWISEFCDENLITAGYFYVSAYSPSAMVLSPFPPTGLVKTATCAAAESNVQTPLALSRVGWVSMGGGTFGSDSDGCNPLVEPCDEKPVPVIPTTWGQIKKKYKN